jgi:hypothetical protein
VSISQAWVRRPFAGEVEVEAFLEEEGAEVVAFAVDAGGEEEDFVVAVGAIIPTIELE